MERHSGTFDSVHCATIPSHLAHHMKRYLNEVSQAQRRVCAREIPLLMTLPLVRSREGRLPALPASDERKRSKNATRVSSGGCKFRVRCVAREPAKHYYRPRLLMPKRCPRYIRATSSLSSQPGRCDNTLSR